MFTKSNKEEIKMRDNGNFSSYKDILEEVTDEEIVIYLKDVCKMTDELVEEQITRFKQHGDIYEEFKYAYFGIKHHGVDALCFAVNEPVTEQGYTAYSLYHKFGDRLLPIGIFNLLISLREERQETLDYIKMGLTNKDDNALLDSDKDFENLFYEKGEEKLQKRNLKEFAKKRKKVLKRLKKEGVDETDPFA